METRILVIFTGGTIGSSIHSHIIQPNSAANFALISKFQQHYSQYQYHFTAISAFEILSENLHPQLWLELIAVIESQALSNYDGIIVTHGTDTLAFTAAALSLYFHSINKPLLLVSSNYALSDIRSNGLNNFYCAVEFIRQQIQNGVFVAYQNPQQAMQIHLGSRLSSCLPLSGDFISLQSQAYMTFTNGQFILLSNRFISIHHPIHLSLPKQFSKSIFIIRPYPGLNYRDISLIENSIILHDLYHSGTACTTMNHGKDYSLLRFCERCFEANVDLYLVSALKNADIYSSMNGLIEKKINVLWNVSLEVAYIKLLFAYHCFTDKQQLDYFLTTNISGEEI